MTDATMSGRARAAAVIAERPMPRRVKQPSRWCKIAEGSSGAQVGQHSQDPTVVVWRGLLH